MIQCNSCDMKFDPLKKTQRELNEILVEHITRHLNDELIKNNFTLIESKPTHIKKAEANK